MRNKLSEILCKARPFNSKFQSRLVMTTEAAPVAVSWSMTKQPLNLVLEGEGEMGGWKDTYHRNKLEE